MDIRSTGVAGAAVVLLFLVEWGVDVLVGRLGLGQTADTLLGVLVLSVVMVAVGLWLRSVSGMDISFDVPTDEEYWYVAIGIGGLTLLSLAGAGFGAILGATPAGASARGDVAGSTVGVILLIVLSVMAVAPVEELIFRGLVQGGVKVSGRDWVGLIVASVLYAIYHVNVLDGTLVGIGIAFGVLFASGLLLGGLYERSETLVVPILAHGLYNAAVLVPSLLTAL